MGILIRITYMRYQYNAYFDISTHRSTNPRGGRAPLGAARAGAAGGLVAAPQGAGGRAGVLAAHTRVRLFIYNCLIDLL